MTHGSLFSGIGGFDLAAQWCGWTNIFQCENDPFCQRVLKYYFPKTILYEDIKTTDFTEWNGRIDILTAGFPCQPFSNAGQRRGTDDDRYFWPEVKRIIRETQPPWFVGENVTGITSMVQPGSEIEVENPSYLFGEDYTETVLRQEYVIETICGDLEREGYSVHPVIIPACAVEAPHRRDRIFFISHRGESGTGAFADADSNDAERYRHGETYCPDGETESKRIVAGVGRAFDFGGERIAADTNGKRPPGRNKYIKQIAEAPGNAETGGFCSNRIAPHPDGSRRLQDDENKQTGQLEQNIPNWRNFPTQSPVCNRNDGFPGRLDGITFPAWRNGSIHALGNAVVPQVAYEIFKIIRNIINLET
ncbi:MAG: DNA cytosine methyltransferase [Tannerella sp.]|jgi:DNA (cytosine-5)-methyltransferase 1|nr:DNA cytosine methyltransferase [Tannerella sp.]